jgi:CheY-like chemotaxis protein/anti-sigma regulatory factor (Ser/Thr protein kinase)
MTSILVIDDEPDNFDVIETLLSYQAYDLQYSANGQDAIASLDFFQPDVILLDVMMPDMDGIEVCQRIKAIAKWQPVPIIMVTALTSKEDLSRCLEAGADDFITKPVNSLELRARLNSMLRIKRQYDQLNTLFNLQKDTTNLLQNNLDQLCGNIVSILPHEINTPLNGVFGIIDLLVDGYQDMDTEEIHEMLEIAQQSTHKLEKLTKRFLLYAQLEVSTTNPSTNDSKNTNHPKISTQPLIENAIKNIAQTYNRINDLILDLENIEVSMREPDLLWIINELLDNAFKFSNSGTPVKVSSKSHDGMLELSIFDRGRGMTAEQIAKIGAFTQFERKHYEQQGMGLGLKIVQKIVGIYGGEFSISSIYQQCMTVHIKLPAS